MASPTKFAHVVYNTHAPLRRDDRLVPSGARGRAANEFIRGPAFDANPIGEPFDPDEMVARFEAGASVDQIVFRSDQKPVPLAGVHRAGTPA